MALRRRDRVSRFGSSGQSLWGASQGRERNIGVFGLGHGALGLRLGQGQAREAGTEKSDVSGISLSRAKGQLVAQADDAQVSISA
jgi:hypothetical protein